MKERTAVEGASASRADQEHMGRLGEMAPLSARACRVPSSKFHRSQVRVAPIRPALNSVRKTTGNQNLLPLMDLIELGGNARERGHNRRVELAVGFGRDLFHRLLVPEGRAVRAAGISSSSCSR